MQKYSNWLIYPGSDFKRIPALDLEHSYSYKKYEKNNNRDLNPYEKGRVDDLRKWANAFFYSNSLRYISWWNNKKPGEANQENVDLILKCTSSSKNKLKFVDEE